MIASERNLENSSNEVLIVSRNYCIIDFVKSIIGENVTHKIQSQLVEMSFLVSTFVFLDASSVNLENYEAVNSFIGKHSSKILLIVPFGCNQRVLKNIANLCHTIIPYPSAVLKAKNLFLSTVKKSESLQLNTYSNIRDEELLKYSELDDILGSSEHIIEIKKRIINSLSISNPILILGETGTGKSTIARIIHNISARKNNNYFQLNISTIPENLADSELFGTEQGAYTDAHKREGIIKACDGGTLFIDEIGTAPLSIQSKLLVFIDTGEFNKVGSDRMHKADVKLIFATNDNLKLKVMQGEMRKDIVQRIMGYVIYLAPLRERTGDISVIANAIAKKHGCTITDAALEKLEGYSWPGNVRQLKYCIERACNRGNSQIDSQDLEWYN